MIDMGKENKETETLVINQNLYRNKDWLYNEYINKKRSAPNIAKECGIHERTLRRWIDKFGLIDIKRQAKNINKDDLFRMYRIEKMSTDDIGKLYDADGATILYHLHKFGIPIFSRKEILETYFYERGGIEHYREIFNNEENKIQNSCRQRGIDIDDFDEFATTKAHRDRNNSKYKEWKQNVFERDNYTCQCCGKRGGTLNAHHLHNFSQYPELMYDIDNGVTVCDKCHLVNYPNSFHSLYGEKNNTPEQFYEYVKLRKAKEAV